MYFRVKLHPYRGADEVKTMSFTVPKDQPLGDMILEIRGGGVIPLPYLIEKQRYNLTDEILERLRHYKDFADLKKTIEGEDANNDLVIEILQQGVSMIDDGGEKVVKEKIRGKEPPVQNKDIVKPDKRGLNDTGDREDAKSSIATPYIVKGDGQITIKVVSPAERDASWLKIISSTKRRPSSAKKRTKPRRPATKRLKTKRQGTIRKMHPMAARTAATDRKPTPFAW